MWFRSKEKIKRPLFRRIINYFIYFGVGVIILLLIAFGFSQTSSFRSWLKDTITEQVNTSTNGVLAIERIDGTLFSSLVLINTLYKFEGDTVFAAEKIEIKTSPLKLLFKIIYFRKIEIDNANIAFLKDENGELNISRIVPPSDEPEDTLPSTFSWKLQVADLSLNNINFKLQSHDNKNSYKNYTHPNWDDLQLDNLNIRLSAFADLVEHEYDMYLREMNVKPNLIGFTLKNLSGNFLYLDDQAGVTDLNIVTEKSNISLSAAIAEFPLFSDEEIQLENAPLRLDLAATDFHFDDLTTFIEGTSLLKGNITVHLSTSGTLSELNIEKLKSNFGETQFELTGWLQNTLAGGDMRVDTRFKDFTVNQDDIKGLLPSIGIPHYPQYGILEFDSLYFKGKPLSFDAGYGLRTALGNVSSKLIIDLSGNEITYDAKIKTRDLNLAPVIGMTTKINSLASVKGKDFSPASSKTELKLKALNSTIGTEFFNEINIEVNGKEGIINSQIQFASRETNGSINSQFNFTTDEATNYKFDIALNGFDVQDFVKDSDFGTKLNIKLNGEGENFNPDHLNLFTVVQIDSSNLNGLTIDSTRVIVDIRSGEKERVVNVISDLADVTVRGNFRLPDLIDAVRLEANLVASTIQKKIEAIQPPKFFDDQLTSRSTVITDYDLENLIKSKDFQIDYLLEFKDFELLSLLLGDSEIDVDGELNGKFFVRQDSMSLVLDSEISQFKYWNGTDLYYLSDFDLELSIQDRISHTSFEGFAAGVSLFARRIFMGSEIRDLEFNLKMDTSYTNFNLEAFFEDYLTLNTRGSMDLTGSDIHVLLDDFLFKYNEFDVTNKDVIDFSYSDDEFMFNSFLLAHQNGAIDLKGIYSFTDDGDIELLISNINSEDLFVNLFNLPREKTPDSDFNLNLKYTGTADNPKVVVDFSLDSVFADKVFLGFVKCSLNYDSKRLYTDIKFIKNKIEGDDPWLGIKGFIPVNFSTNSNVLFPEDDELKLNFFADNFDLRFIGHLIPGISNLYGTLEGDINLTGTYNDMNSDGHLQFKYSSFLLEANNLTYIIDAGLVLKKDELSLARFSISNSKETKGGGTITASGKVVFDNFELKEISVQANGDLVLLSQTSRAANPNLYGDISIRTREDIQYVLNEEQNYLSADLILKRGANVTFSPSQSAFTNETDKITYLFTSADDLGSKDKVIDSLIVISESINDERALESKIPFDLDIKIQVASETKAVFTLNREFGQKLIAYLDGNIDYLTKDEKPTASGELILLEGSKLDFIKTFQAQGSIKFLDDITNPYLNVMATYESFYNPDTLSSSGNEYEVQVRIRLEGPVKSLMGSNFLNDPQSITVHKRLKNFGQFELDPEKNANDALYYIVYGGFPGDIVQQTNVATSTAFAIVSSILGGALNEQFGDFVRSVNVQQVGTETRFSLVGKIGDARYEIGGNSQVFQDLSRANIKIEYPFIFTRLILRLERREPAFQSTTYGEMINELGLKYSFTF